VSVRRIARDPSAPDQVGQGLLHRHHALGLACRNLGSELVIVAFADEILHEAVTRMVRHDIGRLPVVRRDNPRLIVGYLGRASIMTARLRRHEEEYNREPGWLQAFTQ